ncbi:MAG: biotin transporter BioY [Firmicutes bacterium]|nr:biotin transporter BioY [Bacillota bacterium]
MTTENLIIQNEIENNNSIESQTPLPIENLKNKKIPTKLLARMGVFVALLIVATQTQIAMPAGVPINLQTLALMLIAISFKPLFAVLILLIFVAMGAMFIPIFANFNNLYGAIIGPTMGFLIAFIPGMIFMAFMIHLLEKAMPHDKLLKEFKTNRNKITTTRIIIKYSLLLVVFIVFTIIHLAGGSIWFWLVFRPFFYTNPTPVSYSFALTAVVVPFLPVEAIKIVTAMLIYAPLVKFRNK